MKYFEKNIEGLSVFELEGKIMGGTPDCISLCNRVKEVIASGQKNIVIDFDRVRWINSTGIGFMLSCVMTLRREGGEVHFVGLHDRVDYYFKITKIDTVLQIYKNVDEVVKKLSLSAGIPSS
ncbi:STAS domain-containing protein [candidate division KSB1 bacterium]|nr:STAS domain-containing protein [candidate division KSB1 bacterium]MCH8955729.1 STAS domain-containing protein [candidate division KSB1 bacterium]